MIRVHVHIWTFTFSIHLHICNYNQHSCNQNPNDATNLFRYQETSLIAPHIDYRWSGASFTTKQARSLLIFFVIAKRVVVVVVLLSNAHGCSEETVCSYAKAQFNGQLSHKQLSQRGAIKNKKSTLPNKQSISFKT